MRPSLWRLWYRFWGYTRWRYERLNLAELRAAANTAGLDVAPDPYCPSWQQFVVPHGDDRPLLVCSPVPTTRVERTFFQRLATVFGKNHAKSGQGET